VIIPVTVEKLAHHDVAKTASRQEALSTIFPSLLDIFYYPIVDFFQKNRLFQQPPVFATVIHSGVQRKVDGVSFQAGLFSNVNFPVPNWQF
jgi:hypothetical protein